MAGSRADKWRNRKAGSLPSQRLLKLLAGAMLLAAASLPMLDFPALGFFGVILGALYLGTIFVLPRLWLFVLPVATVLLDLTPFTGRFLFSEFDYLVLLTICSGLLFNRYRLSVYRMTPAIALVLLFLALLVLRTSDWQFFLIPPQSEVDNPYYSGGYSYKLVKGWLWGAALVPMWGYHLARNKQASINYLLSGFVSAALALGLVVLWERGTVGQVLRWDAWYFIVQSVLDLSSSYRITGIFSDMHTGGEVVDGVILLLLPACLFALYQPQNRVVRILGALGCMSLAYATLVGFTRSTYVSFLAGFLVFSFLFGLQLRSVGRKIGFPVRGGLVGAVFCCFVSVYVYRWAGLTGLIAAIFAMMLGSVFPYLDRRRHGRTAWVLMLATIMVLGVYSQLNSRWVEASQLKAVLVGLMLLLAAIISLAVFTRSSIADLGDRLVVVGLYLAIPTVLALAFGGYQMGDRVSRSLDDLGTRVAHWGDVRLSSADGLFSQLLGNGVGSFPSAYVASKPEALRQVGSFRVNQEGSRSALVLGNGRDLVLGQRVGVEPGLGYTANVRARSDDGGRLSVGLCERNILYASNFTPNCVQKWLEVPQSSGEFQELKYQLLIQEPGREGALARWPTVLVMRYWGEGTVEIDFINFSPDGFNVLRNSGFSKGLDYWFYYNDFSHLPWHTKNLWLQLWFELGLLGLILFGILVTMLVTSSLRNRSGYSVSAVYTSGVATIALFGLFGSPLDSSRVAWIFAFYLFSGLAHLRAQKPSSRAHRLP